MADQEFLASFAVEIDEGGVSRLQEILSQNRELAEGLAEAFSLSSGTGPTPWTTCWPLSS